MKYIETLHEGERLSGIYLCKYRQSAMTKNGKSYENVILQDKTGVIDAKIWDPNSQGIEDFDMLDYIDVVGDVTSFQGALQVSIKRVRKAREGEYIEEDYLPVSERNIDEMYEELLTYVHKIENPYLKQLTDSYFVENEAFIKAFKGHSAAKSVHHGFVGGLLEHTLNVTKLCYYYVKQYPFLNKDLLLCAALFHDVGKMKEISRFPENDYTDDGQLLGHGQTQHSQADAGQTLHSPVAQMGADLVIHLCGMIVVGVQQQTAEGVHGMLLVVLSVVGQCLGQRNVTKGLRKCQQKGVFTGFSTGQNVFHNVPFAIQTLPAGRTGRRIVSDMIFC